MHCRTGSKSSHIIITVYNKYYRCLLTHRAKNAQLGSCGDSPLLFVYQCAKRVSSVVTTYKGYSACQQYPITNLDDVWKQHHTPAYHKTTKLIYTLYYLNTKKGSQNAGDNIIIYNICISPQEKK